MNLSAIKDKDILSRQVIDPASSVGQAEAAPAAAQCRVLWTKAGSCDREHTCVARIRDLADSLGALNNFGAQGRGVSLDRP